MIRTSHRLPLSWPLAILVLCLMTACPVFAGASLEVGYFDDGNWVTLSGTASGVMRICVKYMPPPGKQATGVSLQQIRVTDKRGEHTIPVQFDAGVPLQGGKAAAYLWRSFLDTNGPISIEAEGTASTFAPPPVGSGMESFTVSCSCQSENLTVVSLTNDSALAGLGLVAFWPSSQTHSVTAVFADSPDPHGQTPDQGTAQIALHAIGPNGLGAVEWSWGSGSVDLSNGLTHTEEVTRGQNGPAVYAPNAGATEADEDCHSWYSPYASVQGVSVSRAGVTGTRTMDLWVEHTNVVPDATNLSELSAFVESMAPMSGVCMGSLACQPGAHSDLVAVGPCAAAGTHKVFVVGRDGHGGMSKHSGNVEHRIAPAAAEFTIPPASCIAGSQTGGDGNGEYPAAQQYAQVGWDELGSVACQADASQSCFYSARYEYGQGWRGGYLDRPDKAQTLDALFADKVVIFNGHGSEVTIRNREFPEKVTADSIRGRRDQSGEPSRARLVLLECRQAAKDTPISVASALEYAGVDCIIGWTINCPGSDPGYFQLLDLMCNQGMWASDAYDQVCDDHADEWGPGKTRIVGDTYLWGEPI